MQQITASLSRALVAIAVFLIAFVPLASRGDNGVQSTGAAAVPAQAFLPLVARGCTGDVLCLGPGSRLGIWTGAVGDDAQADVLKDTGAKWTRITLTWSSVETSPGSYRWDAFDKTLKRLHDRGIQPIVEIRGNPTWAASTTCGPIDRPGGLDRFEAFVRAAVTRYSAADYDVHHWEFYNEPDNTDTVKLGPQVGGCFGNYPAEYKAMLERAYRAVHSADSSGKVVLGGLAFDYYVDRQQYPNCNSDNCFSPSFLNDLLEADGGAHFDVANVHAFSSHNQGPRGENPLVSRFWSNGFDVVGKVETFRQVMRDHGLDKPVIVSELSWTSNNNLELQARYVPKVLARGLAANLYAMTWFQLVDGAYGWDSGTPVYYGLTEPAPSYAKRNSYRAFQAAAREFGEATSVRRLAASEAGASSGVEGYAFEVGGEERWVLWAREDGKSDGGDSSVVIHLPGRATTAYDKLGQPISLGITRIDDNPVYVRLRKQ